MLTITLTYQLITTLAMGVFNIVMLGELAETDKQRFKVRVVPLSLMFSVNAFYAALWSPPVYAVCALLAASVLILMKAQPADVAGISSIVWVLPYAGLVALLATVFTMRNRTKEKVAMYERFSPFLVLASILIIFQAMLLIVQ